MSDDTFCSMRNLGAVFGVSSHVIGGKLKELGLRSPNGQPSCQAIEAGLVQCVQGPQPWVTLWLWNKELTAVILQDAGFKALAQPVVSETLESPPSTMKKDDELS